MLYPKDQRGKLGVGVYSGPCFLWQGHGNIIMTDPEMWMAHPLSWPGPMIGSKLRFTVIPQVAVMVSTQYQRISYKGVPNPRRDKRLTPKNMTTKIMPVDLDAVINLAPECKYNPYLTVGGGLSWWMTNYPDSFAIGDEIKGTLKFGAGLEVFLSNLLSLDILLRYSYIFTDYDIFPTLPYCSLQRVNAVLDLQVGANFYLGGQRDTDGDGIPDKRDKCVTVREDFDKFEDTDGCPDLDNDRDGVPDVSDQCNNTTLGEVVDSTGCPPPIVVEPVKDTDQDGIYDDQDRCPKDPEDKDGFLDEDGCPDLDNDRDGVMDSRDKCSNTPAGIEVDSLGCPLETIQDGDEDGILDKDDKCPGLREDMDGFQDLDGCPDLDNDQDGVVDSLDKCRNHPEDLDNFQDEDGCPDFDNDRDGVVDSLDKCPTEREVINNYQDEDGCPDVKPAEIERGAKMILRGIKFESGSAALLDESYPILDEVFKSLEAYPEVMVEICGYTDLEGGFSYNLELSQKRADSVKNYLVNRGIAAARLTARGYGPADPVASNKTAAGRAENRRIEFHRVD